MSKQPPYHLTPKEGFDWRRVVWSPPHGRIVNVCSYCFGKVGKVPLHLWSNSKGAAHFCDDCMHEWWGMT